MEPISDFKYITDILSSNDNYLDMFVEYGEINHEHCKTIYENPNNEDLIIEMVANIHNRGGVTALYNNLKVLNLVFNENHLESCETSCGQRLFTIIGELWSM